MAFSQINNIMQLKCCFLCNASSANTITKCSDFTELLVISLSVTVLPAQLLHLSLPLTAEDVRLEQSYRFSIGFNSSQQKGKWIHI